MSTMVIKCEGKISNPLNNPVITGAIVTSDTFSGNNADILGRVSDCLLGGQAVTWRGFQGFSSAGVYEIKNGVAQATVKNGVFGAVGLDVSLKNIAVQFKVTRFDAGLIGSGNEFTAFFDVRRVNGTSTAYRLGFNQSGLTLMHRNANNVFKYLGTTNFKVGDTILYLAKENSHKVYVNGVLKINVISDDYVGEGYTSLARGVLATDDTWAIDDLILYSL